MYLYSIDILKTDTKSLNIVFKGRVSTKNANTATGSNIFPKTQAKSLLRGPNI